MAQIKAIETRYAGCRFRSRLEARWAVAFDHLGIEWEYEPQGMVVTNRLGFDDLPDEWAYLPDFWLPKLRLWVEIKGSLSDLESKQLMSAAAHLTTEEANGLAVFGSVPRPAVTPEGTASPIFMMHSTHGLSGRETLRACRWRYGRGEPWYGGLDPFLAGAYIGLLEHPLIQGGTLVRETGEIVVMPDFVHGWAGGNPTAEMLAAYTAARSARFEHGERG